MVTMTMKREHTVRSGTLEAATRTGAKPLAEQLRQGLATTIEATSLDALGKKYEGKVRDNYSTADGRRYVVAIDRISAFDRVIGTLPSKGQLLTSMAAFWFDKTKDLVPNHVLSVPDPSVMECIECVPLPVEMIMRAYVTGVTSTSIWTHYKNGAREFCGHQLPEGLKKNQKLPAPILTPSTKAEKGDHDVSASREEILRISKMPAAHFDEAAAMAATLFAVGQAHASAQGLILVDTKYEFGMRPDGQIVVIDEIHTPDSSRYWIADTYDQRFGKSEEPESFDKEYVRRWLADQGYKGDGPTPPIPDEIRIEATLRYVKAWEKICGVPFVPNLEEPHARMRKNLGLEKGA
ncbi:MAG: phosphoribosylaminoimidazolesuccinocarboxamide synthase [Polyangiales bacterium]